MSPFGTKCSIFFVSLLTCIVIFYSTLHLLKSLSLLFNTNINKFVIFYNMNIKLISIYSPHKLGRPCESRKLSRTSVDNESCIYYVEKHRLSRVSGLELDSELKIWDLFSNKYATTHDVVCIILKYQVKIVEMTIIGLRRFFQQNLI